MEFEIWSKAILINLNTHIFLLFFQFGMYIIATDSYNRIRTEIFGEKSLFINISNKAWRSSYSEIAVIRSVELSSTDMTVGMLAGVFND